MIYGDDVGSNFVFQNVPVVITVNNFDIRHGQANSGGGIYIYDSSPVFINCDIRENAAYSVNDLLPAQGGGIYVQGGSPLFAYCIINGNDATHALSTMEGKGGGMFLLNSAAIFYYCDFGPTWPWNHAEEDITAEIRLYTYTGIPSFYFCTTRGNPGLTLSVCNSYPNQPYVEN